MTRETELLSDKLVVIVVLTECLISLRNDTELIELDTVVRSYENTCSKEGGEEGDEQDKTVEDSADGEVTLGSSLRVIVASSTIKVREG